MDKMAPPYIYPATALCGGTLAQLTIPNPEADQRYSLAGLKFNAQQLVIITASTIDEPGGYCPAESIRVLGREALVKLRDFLVEHVKDEVKA